MPVLSGHSVDLSGWNRSSDQRDNLEQALGRTCITCHNCHWNHWLHDFSWSLEKAGWLIGLAQFALKTLRYMLVRERLLPSSEKDYGSHVTNATSPLTPETDLPPVDPPTAGFIVQLFVFVWLDLKIRVYFLISDNGRKQPTNLHLF